jgi:hypothetical protein
MCFYMNPNFGGWRKNVCRIQKTANRKRTGDTREPVRTHINTILNYHTKWLKHMNIMSETELCISNLNY